MKSAESTLRLYKREKLCSEIAIGRVLGPGSQSDGAALVYPLRMVWGFDNSRGGAPVQFLISVPKRRIRHAVDRVTIRRRIREAYRLNRKTDIHPAGKHATNVAFIYVANETLPSDRIHRAMRRLLDKLYSLPTENSPCDNENT